MNPTMSRKVVKRVDNQTSNHSPVHGERQHNRQVDEIDGKRVNPKNKSSHVKFVLNNKHVSQVMWKSKNTHKYATIALKIYSHVKPFNKIYS